MSQLLQQSIFSNAISRDARKCLNAFEKTQFLFLYYSDENLEIFSHFIFTVFCEVIYIVTGFALLTNISKQMLCLHVAGIQIIWFIVQFAAGSSLVFEAFDYV